VTALERAEAKRARKAAKRVRDAELTALGRAHSRAALARRMYWSEIHRNRRSALTLRNLVVAECDIYSAMLRRRAQP
jgi:hypothetical protein